MAVRRKSTTTNVQRPKINITIALRDDGSVEIDPQYNKPAIQHLDMLYTAAEREDYEVDWGDDHKMAYFLGDMVDQVLAQWESPETPDEPDGEAGVPHIKEAPVRDVYDIKDLGIAKVGKTYN